MNEAIEKFFSSDAYAVVGVSEDRRKFGNAVFREMRDREFNVYPVNPRLSFVEDRVCYKTVSDLPEEVRSVVIVVQPQVAEQVVAECKWKGIENIWLQRGAQSREAIAYAKENGLNLVHGECVLMFLEPVKSFHALHRWVKKLTGTYAG
jgi:predicted CoA-binding protein